MWPIFLNIMSVVVAVVRHRTFSYTLPTLLNGISNQNCWCDCTMAFSIPTALQSIGELQNINWACNGEYHIQSRMVDQNNDYVLWKKAANLSLFSESLKWMKWSECRELDKKTVKNLSSVQISNLFWSYVWFFNRLGWLEDCKYGSLCLDYNVCKWKYFWIRNQDNNNFL